MKLLTLKKLWILLSILLLITACPDPSTTSKTASFTLNLSQGAPGTVVIASLKNMTGIGATVTVAEKPAKIVSTSVNQVSFEIPNVAAEKYGIQKVVIKSGKQTASNRLKIIHAKFSLNKSRAARGETVIGTIQGISLDNAKLSVANKEVDFQKISNTKFSFVIPKDAPSNVQQVRITPKNGRELTSGIEILGNVVKNKVSIVVNPAKVAGIKAILSGLGFDVSGQLKELGGKGACAGEYAEIDIGGIPLGEALEKLKALEDDHTLFYIDPVADWVLGGEAVDHIGVIGADDAHKRRLSGKGTMIAILDTGVNPHSDIETKIRYDLGYNFVGNNKDVKDNYNDKSLPYKNEGHGTPIAVLAAGDELGVAPKAEIMPVKVCDKNGSCLSSNVILGVCHALEKAPNRKKLVINLSLGGDTRVKALEAILRYALDEGVLVAAAAGNQGLHGSPTHYPAAFILEGLVSVGALKQKEREWLPADFSTRGNVDISAPGENLSSGPASREAPIVVGFKGTSFATGLVSGALAIWRQAHPEMTPAEIEKAIVDSATDLVKAGCPVTVCTPDAVGAGMLNLSVEPKLP